MRLQDSNIRQMAVVAATLATGMLRADGQVADQEGKTTPSHAIPQALRNELAGIYFASGAEWVAHSSITAAADTAPAKSKPLRTDIRRQDDPSPGLGELAKKILCGLSYAGVVGSLFKLQQLWRSSNARISALGVGADRDEAITSAVKKERFWYRFNIACAALYVAPYGIPAVLGIPQQIPGWWGTGILVMLLVQNVAMLPHLFPRRPR